MRLTPSLDQQQILENDSLDLVRGGYCAFILNSAEKAH